MTSYKHEHTHLTSPDPEKAVDFYVKIMGAEVVKEQIIGGQKTVDLDMGGITIRISGGTAADKVWEGPRYGLHHLGLVVNNIDAVIADLKSKEVTFVVEPIPGTKAAFIKGPDNVLFELSGESN